MTVSSRTTTVVSRVLPTANVPVNGWYVNRVRIRPRPDICRGYFRLAVGCYTGKVKTYLGIDYGSKRVGVAIGDDETKLARPLVTLANTAQLVADLQSLVTQRQAVGLVVGLPRGLDGQETKQTKTVQTAISGMHLAIPVHWQDEAVTSEVAAARGASAKELDAEAAAIILQDYLDGL